MYRSGHRLQGSQRGSLGLRLLSRAGCPNRMPQVTQVVHAGFWMEMSRRRGAMCSARSKYVKAYIDAVYVPWVGFRQFATTTDNFL